MALTKEEKAIYNKQYYQKNKEKHSEHCKSYRASNKDRIRTQVRNRLQTDENFRLAHNLRRRMNRARKGLFKSGSAVGDLGCSMDFFKEYISSKFIKGMSWDNYGEWHLDHVKPLASFDLTDREQFLVASHYTNYQPLWALDNIRKGATVPTRD